MTAAPRIDGTWINQNGSVVELESDPQGRLSGVYVSARGRAASGRRYPVVGTRNGEVLAFQVSWQDDEANLEAITSFTGRLGVDRDGREVLHTVWVLARRWEDEAQTRPTGLWNAFLTNSDVFHRAEG